MTDGDNSTFDKSNLSENMTISELMSELDLASIPENLTKTDKNIIDYSFEDTNTTIYVYTALILGCIIFTIIRLYDCFHS